jgi:hypothetical protein
MNLATLMAGMSRGSRRWRPVVIGLLALPVVALLLGNLILSTPWACHKTAVKLQRYTGGLDVHIRSMAFTPWSGISVTGLELLQPAPLRKQVKQPLLTIHSLQIAPVWNAWLRGRMIVQSIELDAPQIVMSVELLAHLTQAGLAVSPAHASLQVTPPVAVLPPVNPAVVGPVAVIQPGTNPASADSSFAPTPPSFPTAWLHLKNASVTLIHAESKQLLLEFSQIGGAIPIAGNPAKSHLTIGSISAAGQPAVSPLSATLEWKSPQLSLDPLEIKIGGHPFLIAAKLASVRGLPLQIEAKLPPHPLTRLTIPLGGQIEADSITAQARFRGLVLAPATWQGDLVAESDSLKLQFSSHEVKFDHGKAITILRGGIFSCVDARLIADKVSVLGNATLLADGRLAGAARIVAAPETVISVARQAFPMTKESPSLTPLSTPQRSAFDLEASGSIHQLFLKLGKDGPMMEFKP